MVERSLEKKKEGPVVSAVFLRVIDGAADVLLVKGKSGAWYFPGGKIEEGESDVDALLRELSEELGVKFVGKDFDFLSEEEHDTPSGKNRRKIINYRFTGKLDDTKLQPRVGDSVSKVAWFTIEDVKKMNVADSVVSTLYKL